MCLDQIAFCKLSQPLQGHLDHQTIWFGQTREISNEECRAGQKSIKDENCSLQSLSTSQNNCQKFPWGIDAKKSQKITKTFAEFWKHYYNLER